MPVKISVERRRTGAPLKFPRSGFPRKYAMRIGRVVVGSTIENIRTQTTTDGKRIKINAPRTRDRKREKGRPQLSLVNKFKRFLNPATYWIKITRKEISVEIKNDTVGGVSSRTLAGYLGNKGYTGWFGLSAKGVRAVRAVVADWIEEMRKEAQKKREIKR